MKKQGCLDYFNLVRDTVDRGELSFIDIKSKDVPSELVEIVRAFFACYSCYKYLRLNSKDYEEFHIVYKSLERVRGLINKVAESNLKLIKS